MNVPQKRTKITEEARKSVQGFYKQGPAKVGLDQSYPAYTLPQQQPSKPSTEGLKNFIMRAFSKCQSDDERDTMEKLIKDVIQTTKNSGKFYTQDWERTEVPLLPREQIVIQNNPSSSFEINQVMKSQKRRKTRFSLYEPKQDSVPKKHPKPAEPEEEQGSWKIVGVCQDLEKPYLRLTSKPDPEKVRPEPVLRKALAHFRDKYKTRTISYEFFSEQLRSIRQDLRVQGINNKFTVEVYQVHARLSIENQDLDQFNSCMSRLFELFREGLPGKKTEFLAYRIVYYTFQNLYLHLEKCLKSLTKLDNKAPEIQHALAVKRALLQGNYHQVFLLRETAPNMGRCVIDIFLEKLRMFSLLKICKAYMPSVELSWVDQELGFNNYQDCVSFLESNGAAIQGGALLCKESLKGLNNSRIINPKV